MKREKLSKKNVIWSIVLILGIVLVGVLIYYFLTNWKNGLIKKEPNYTAAEYYKKAVEQVGTSNYTEAEKYLESALKQQDDSSYRNQLAVVKYRLKKYSESIDQYNLLIEAGKDKAFAWNGIGNCYRDLAEQDSGNSAEDFRLAEDAYRKSFEIDPNYVSAYSNLALMLSDSNKKESALEVINLGISKTKDDNLAKIKDMIGG